MSGWVRRSPRAADVAADAADAVAAALAPPGQVATLILPADVSWTDGGAARAAAPAARRRARCRGEVTGPAAKALRSGEPCVILLGGTGLRRAGLDAASRIAAATGARLLGETFPARLERGAGLPAVERLAYLVEFAAGAARRGPPPDPGRRAVAGVVLRLSRQARRPGARRLRGARPGRAGRRRGRGAGIARRRGRRRLPRRARSRPQRPGLPTGALTAQTAAAVIGALLPEGAIVCDEVDTSGAFLPAATAGAPPHDWLTLTGGAIGHGLPLATGAAIACPDRPVIALEADGSAMYTISALWTQARESSTSPRSSSATAPTRSSPGAAAGRRRAAGDAARSLLDLSRPALDFTALATGMGVPASRATTATEFAAQLGKALAEPGPHLIEAVIP